MQTTDNIICPECKQECLLIEKDDSFDYSGTHCTGGISGTQQLPIYYVSDCCEAIISNKDKHGY